MCLHIKHGLDGFSVQPLILCNRASHDTKHGSEVHVSVEHFSLCRPFYSLARFIRPVCGEPDLLARMSLSRQESHAHISRTIDTIHISNRVNANPKN